MLDTTFNVKSRQISKLNRIYNPSEIKAVNESIPNKRSPPTICLTAEFFHTFKEKLMSLPLKLFHKIETERSLPNSFYKTVVTLIPKPHKDSNPKKKKELHTNFLYEHGCKSKKCSMKYL